uniref:Uncharacterized protein n=1 Tax=Trichogramma kaykai TaxID=54128 RepID=A0ABD2X266_9HYME
MKHALPALIRLISVNRTDFLAFCFLRARQNRCPACVAAHTSMTPRWIRQRVCLAKSQREIERTLAREKRFFSARGCNRFPRTRASNNNRACVFWSEILRASLLDVYLPMRACPTAAGVISSVMQRNNKDDRAVTKTTPEFLRIGALAHIGYTRVGICFKKTAGWKPEEAKEDEGENEEEEENGEGEEGAGECSVAARVNEGREKERNERWGPGYTHLYQKCINSSSSNSNSSNNSYVRYYMQILQYRSKVLLRALSLISELYGLAGIKLASARELNTMINSSGLAYKNPKLIRDDCCSREICANIESPFAPSINSIMHRMIFSLRGLIPCGYRSVWQLFSALIFVNVAHYGGEASTRRLQRRKINVQPSSCAATAAARPCFVVVLAIGISRRAKSINHLLDIILEDCTIRIVRDPQRHSGRGSKRITEKRGGER